MHTVGQKCPQCAINQRARKRSLGKNTFIQKAIKIHGEVYIYNKVKYTNNRTKVDIFCTSCNNYFSQNPDDHLQGHGCRNCYKYGIDITKPITFYILELKHSNEIAYKIGITNKSVYKRYISDNPNKTINKVLLEVSFLDSYDAVLFEKDIKSKLDNYKYKGSTMFFNKTKHTEILMINPLTAVLQAFKLKS